ncbi:MAG: hypothetical protein M3323_15675 [Actinomycetota bacterium]|nr:hypothetical protein [Actinomycetota bacterium]
MGTPAAGDDTQPRRWVFKAGVPKDVATALTTAYAVEGAQEIGCPDDVREHGAIFFAKLTGGESSPSWVVSDRAGRAAVVFDDLVPLAKRLRRNEVFAAVLPRQSMGAGDYQLFEKADGSQTAVARRR